MFSFPPLEPASCDKTLVRRTLLIFFSKKSREWSKQNIILTEKEIIFFQISSLNWYNRGRNLKPGPRRLFLSGVAPSLAQPDTHTAHDSKPSRSDVAPMPLQKVYCVQVKNNRSCYYSPLWNYSGVRGVEWLQGWQKPKLCFQVSSLLCG